jgi:hypothetical protein
MILHIDFIDKLPNGEKTNPHTISPIKHVDYSIHSAIYKFIFLHDNKGKCLTSRLSIVATLLLTTKIVLF